MSSRVAMAAVTAAVAAPLIYSFYSGKSLKEILDEAMGSKPAEEIEVLPGSMAVTAAELEGSSPVVTLGGTPTSGASSAVKNETMSLFARRQSSKKILVSGDSPTRPLDLSKLDMNEAALPGSMAVTAAQVDGQSPSLKLSRDDKGSLLSRRTGAETKTEGPATDDSSSEDHSLQMTITAQQLGADGKPITPTMQLGADTGRRTSLFNRRQSARDIQVSTITAASVHGSAANTIQLGGERSSPSSGRASLFARRSMKKMNTLEGTLEVTAEGGVKEVARGTARDPPRDTAAGGAGGAGGEGGDVGRQVASAAANVQLGWARSKLEVARGRWREAQDKLEAREADYEAMDQSTPQGAAKIRNWHQKQVEMARTAAKAAERELKEQEAAVAAAEASRASLQQ